MEMHAGQTLLHYRLVEPLGRGGMGVVWKAMDTSLDRLVALKFLVDSYSHDPEQLARFEREAKLLAALNHSSIATAYGVHEIEGIPVLAMEWVQGVDLATRLRDGPLPLEDALRVAIQIARALEAAHAAGIVHRDLKPANVMVDQDCQVKVLDLGLAKSFAPRKWPPDPDAATELIVNPTQIGSVMGTAAYMSPEQARGEEADARSDIFSFGVLLYETLTGGHPFPEPASEPVRSRILTAEPVFRALEGVSDAVFTIFRRCLRKRPSDRFNDTRDLVLALEDVVEHSRSAHGSDDMRRDVGRDPNVDDRAASFRSGTMLLVLLAFSVGVVGTFLATRNDVGPTLPTAVQNRTPIRSDLDLPADSPLAPAALMPLGVGRSCLALSPNGRWLAMVVARGGDSRLVIRDMSAGTTRTVPGSEGGHSPFFGPDGVHLAYFAQDELRRVDVSSLVSRKICSATEGFGGTWCTNDTIYFSAEQGAQIHKVASSGGADAVLPPAVRHGIHPESLLDGDVLLVTSGGNVVLRDLRIGESKELIDDASFARYLPTGHILFACRTQVMAVAFDTKRLEVVGSPMVVADGIRYERKGASQFTVSHNGLLVMGRGGDATIGQLRWVARDGSVQALESPSGDFRQFRISPDGRFVALPIDGESGVDIWLHDLLRSATTRFTFEGSGHNPLWSLDGESIFYRPRVQGEPHLCRRSIRDPEDVEVIPTSQWFNPHCLSIDGRTLVATSGRTIWLLSVSVDASGSVSVARERAFVDSGGHMYFPALSPDDRWLAYTSDETGSWEVYVRSFPEAGDKVRISMSGGEEPRWSPDADTLYYRIGSRWYAVAVTAGGRFEAGVPQLLFEGPFVNIPGVSYDVSPADGRLLVVESREQESEIAKLELISGVDLVLQEVSGAR